MILKGENTKKSLLLCLYLISKLSKSIEIVTKYFHNTRLGLGEYMKNIAVIIAALFVTVAFAETAVKPAEVKPAVVKAPAKAKSTKPAEPAKTVKAEGLKAPAGK